MIATTIEAHRFLVKQANDAGFEFWGLSTFRARLRAGAVPAYRQGAELHGRRYRFDKKQLNTWLTETWIPAQRGERVGP